MSVRSAVIAAILATCVFTCANAEQSLADSIIEEMEADEISPLVDEELIQVEDSVAAGAACVNIAPDASCGKWAKAGQCHTLPEYMEKNCAKICGFCGGAATGSAQVTVTTVKTTDDCTNTEETYECRGWAAEGQCKSNEAYMKKHCAKACGFCGSFHQSVKGTEVSTFRAKMLNCEDVHSTKDCKLWADDGQCMRNSGFMRVMCKKSCGLCGPAVKKQVVKTVVKAPVVKPPVQTAPVQQHVEYGGLVNGTSETTVTPVMRKQTDVRYIPVHKTVVEYHNVTEEHEVPVYSKVVTHKEIPQTVVKKVHIPIDYTTRTVYKTHYLPQLQYKTKDTYEPIFYNKTEHLPEPEIKYVTKSMDVPTLTYVTKTKDVPVVTTKNVKKNVTVMEKVPVIKYIDKPVQKTIIVPETHVTYITKNYSVPVLGTKTITQRIPIELNRTVTKIVRKEVEKPVYRKEVVRIPVVKYKNVTTAHVIKTAHATKLEKFTKMVPENQVHNVVRYKTIRTQKMVKQQIPETAQRREVYTRYVVDRKATAERYMKVAQRQSDQTSRVVSTGVSGWTKEGPGRVVEVGTPHVVSQHWSKGEEVTTTGVTAVNTTMD